MNTQKPFIETNPPDSQEANNSSFHSDQQTISDWTNHPTGKIPTGTFCDHCGRYNARNSTATMIGIQNDKVLLIKRKRDPQKNWWAMPGGYLDWNETLKTCAIREFFEETGLKIDQVKFLGIYDALDRDKDGRQNIDHCFVGIVPHHQTPHIPKDEVLELEWFDFNSLPENIAFDHRQMLNDYLNSAH